MKTLLRIIFPLIAACTIAGTGHGKSHVETIATKLLPDTELVSIYVPTAATDSNRCPTVYLLNGHGGDHRSWNSVIPIDSLAEAYGCIIVCPSGMNSWYWDAPADSTMRMESFIVDELIPMVDANYPTIPRRDARAITGLSMGGHGALWLAIRHQDLFGSAGSTSGGVDFRPWPKSWNIPDRLGAYATNPHVWDAHTITQAVDTLRPGALNLIIDCGTEDFFYGVNCALHAKLTQMGIDHLFLTSPGVHNAAYWRRSILPQMDFFTQGFSQREGR